MPNGFPTPEAQHVLLVYTGRRVLFGPDERHILWGFVIPKMNPFEPFVTKTSPYCSTYCCTVLLEEQGLPPVAG